MPVTCALRTGSTLRLRRSKRLLNRPDSSQAWREGFWFLVSLRDPGSGCPRIGPNPERGGTLLATRVSGWDASSFFAIEPPNGGGTSWISVAPVRGLLSRTRDRHPRAYATWIEEYRPYRGLEIFNAPRYPGLTLGYFLTSLAGAQISESMPQPTCCRCVGSIPDSKKLILADLNFYG
jgi:hypothetical protein